MKRWRVIKRDGEWRVLDSGVWHDSFPTLPEAHTYATQNAVADYLFEPGGLSRLKELEAVEDAYVKHMLREHTHALVQERKEEW